RIDMASVDPRTHRGTPLRPTPDPGGSVWASTIRGIKSHSLRGGIPVSRWTKLFGAILCLVAIVFFTSWPVWTWLKFRSVRAAFYERTKAVVDRNRQLRPAWDIAMQDGVLTWHEARVILESAGEKVEPE